MNSVLSTCPFCACGCGIYWQVRNNKLNGVAPSEHHPVSKGKLCARGWAAHEATIWGERLTTPLIKKNNILSPCTWKEAIDFVVHKFSDLRTQKKQLGVLGSPRTTNEENFLAVKLAESLSEKRNIDFCLRQTFNPLIAGTIQIAGGLLPKQPSLENIQKANLILLVEGNLATTHPMAAFHIMKALENGASLITLGHIKTQLSKLAKQNLLAPPGLKDISTLTSLSGIRDQLQHSGSDFIPLFGRSNFLGALHMGVAPSTLPGLHSTTQEKGLNAEAMLSSVKGLIILADDPLRVLTNGQQAQRLMEKMECVVLLDSFLTATARSADVVLPIASYAECDGTYTNMEGRVQLVQGAQSPPTDAKQALELLTELISKFGGKASYSSAADVFKEIAATVPLYKGITYTALKENFGQIVEVFPNDKKPDLHLTEGKQVASKDFPYVLVRDGVLDWGSDPLVRFSPTLCRDSISKQKLFPNGIVEISKQDADDLGIREGWKIKLISKHNEVTLPVTLNLDLAPGIINAPFAFREHINALLNNEHIAAIKVERV